MLVIVSFAVVRIREGTVGQTLRALRGSSLGAQAIGISPARARITAFTVSAFIAGLGGALLTMQQQNVNYASNFSPFASLFWLVLVVSLGARTVEGAMQAGAAFGLFDAIVLNGAIFGWILRSPERIPSFFPLSPTWAFVLFGLGALQFARHPEGLVESNKRRATEAVDRRWAAWRGRSQGQESDTSLESPGVGTGATS
jgi:ABC-type branched-subunit amino acid transport system permease subunit